MRPKKIISTLARRAYRRPVNDADLEILLSFYQKGRNKGSFDAGIETALRLILTDPKFLYRIEPDPANAQPGSINRISDLELASRLSFFLWSSIPDDELLTVAAQGKLKDPAVLQQQVEAHAGGSQSGSAGHQLRFRVAVPAQPRRA